MNKTEHLLSCLIEECSEVIQDACKAQRFGIKDHHPARKKQNKDLLTKEINELIAVAMMLHKEGIIDSITNEKIQKDKQQRVLEYMQYAKNLGTLKE